MGIPVVVKGNRHICPMVEGLKPHVGGPVSQTSISGVIINGKPIAVVGDKCICTGGSAPDEIVLGCSGILVDGKPIAVLGSMTQHGGVIIEGVPGVTVSGPLVSMATNPKKLEPKIFNLQWRKEKTIIGDSNYDNKVILSADVIGYENGEEVEIKIYQEKSDEYVDVIKGIVMDGRVEVEWDIDKNKIFGEK